MNGVNFSNKSKHFCLNITAGLPIWSNKYCTSCFNVASGHPLQIFFLIWTKIGPKVKKIYVGTRRFLSGFKKISLRFIKIRSKWSITWTHWSIVPANQSTVLPYCIKITLALPSDSSSWLASASELRKTANNSIENLFTSSFSSLKSKLNVKIFWLNLFGTSKCFRKYIIK